MRISDWSSDVCSSDLPGIGLALRKEVLKRRGAIASAKLRAPGPSLTAEDQAELTRMIERVERRLSALRLAAGGPRAANKPSQPLASKRQQPPPIGGEIGRARCRERVGRSV